MFWIVIGVVIVCAVCSMAGSAEESANADKAKAQAALTSDANARQSRIITSFQELLKEEFPEHASEITFATADQSYSIYTQTFADPALRKHFTLFDKNKFKSDADAATVRDIAVSRGGAAISSRFQDAVTATPDGMNKYLRAYRSAPTRAG